MLHGKKHSIEEMHVQTAFSKEGKLNDRISRTHAPLSSRAGALKIQSALIGWMMMKERWWDDRGGRQGSGVDLPFAAISSVKRERDTSIFYVQP